MRIAIVHYWLLGMRGGEKVVEALCRLVPSADIFTLFYDPNKVSPLIRSHRVTASFLNPLRRSYRSLLPLMPLALEQLDLRGYDLIVSNESGPAKGVITDSTARHICYCHTPIRYLWDMYPAYVHDWTRSAIKRAVMAPLANYLRLWDFCAAARVDQFVASSRNARRRIWKTYRRDASVVYPPVSVGTFRWETSEDYYLVVSELVSYKRIDSAVKLFTKTRRRLRVVGDGPEYAMLRKAAGPNIEFCGRVSDEDLRNLYARCRAFLMPGEEDFGITIVEALASGKAVIGLGRGGILEIAPPEGAFLYDSPDEESFECAIQRFESVEKNISVAAIQSSVKRFTQSRFEQAMGRIIYGDATQLLNPPEVGGTVTDNGLEELENNHDDEVVGFPRAR